jgi:hypothetical protein
VGEEPGPLYRASKLSRGAAWVVLACAAGVSIFGILDSAGTATKAIVVSGLFGLFAWATLRIEVRATPESLIACAGRTIYRFPWSDVRGFEIDERTGREIFVLLKGNARHRLPIVDVATRRIPADDARAELERYWKAHR